MKEDSTHDPSLPQEAPIPDLFTRLKFALADRYAIESEIGRGGMAVVFLAEDLKHHRKVAVKVMLPEVSSDVATERFLREVEIVAGLTHPHIVPLYDSGQADGLLYCVMPFIEGESLLDRLLSEKQLPVEDALQITREVAEALTYAHEQGIIHRDIKPGNILLQRGHAVVADFGIARAIERAAGRGITHTGLAIGTPTYMSPEQGSGEHDLDGRTDIYALGCVLYEMLAGEPPYTGVTPQVVVRRHSLDPVPNIRNIRDTVPESAGLAITKALAKIPADRFATAILFAQALEATAVATPRRDEPSSFSWPVRLAATVIGVTLVAASVYTTLRAMRAEAAAAPGWVAMPIGTGLESPENLALAQQAAEQLNRQLTGWTGLQANASHVLEGVRKWQRLEESEAATLDQAYRMTDSLDIGKLVSISLDVRGDSVDLEAIIYDVSRQRRVEAIIQSGSKLDLDYLVAPVASYILGLNDQEVSIDELRSESQYPIAHQDFQEGLTALYDWRLEAAESHFRAAIDVDSLFARANHYLAVTLFWQTARDPHRIVDVGHEILGLTQTVDSLMKLREIRPGFRSQMKAFGAFWRGDYEEARRAYSEILDQNDKDTEAWLLLGSVEYHDPMLVDNAAGALVPRQSLNEVWKAFEMAAELSPLWQLSHGSLTDINRDLLVAARYKHCPAFELPDGHSWAPWEVAVAGDQVGFCPLLRDSIVWVYLDAVDDELQRRAVEGAEALAVRYQRSLEDWRQTHPRQARPYDELANLLAEQHSTLSCKADSTVIRDGATEILRLRQASLGLRSDTTREDLIRLAVLYLAVDSIESAKAWLDAALQDLPEGEALPDQVANVFLATGRPEPALALTEPVWSENTFSTKDPESEDGDLLLHDIARPIAELEVYGATGRDAEIRETLETLLALLDRHEFSPTQAAHVRRGLLPWIQPALAHSAEARARWFDRSDEAGVEIPAVWRGFLAADAAADMEKPLADLDAALNEVLEGLEGDGETGMISHYLAALLAQLAGRHDEAIEQLNLVESCPTVLDRQSSTWGLRTLRRWHLAQSYRALGDTRRAQLARADYAALRADNGPVP